MSVAGELYLLLAVGAATVFALGLACFSAKQAKLDRARRTATVQTAPPGGTHLASGHA